MDPFIVLFLLAFIWIVAATIQDVRTTEIADWLTFSLIGLGLSYRVVYSIVSGDIAFFWFGLVGFGFFSALGYLFYYGHVFAGGDVKLLVGLGAVLPAASYFDIIVYGFGLIALVFLSGMVWSLAYTVYRVAQRPGPLMNDFPRELRIKKGFMLLVVLAALVCFVLFASFNAISGLLFALAILFVGLLFVYVRVFERHYLIRLKKPRELMEGDWLVSAVSVHARTLEPTVHGLTKDDIVWLRKHKKSVVIRDGIAFTPGFLLGFALFELIYYRIISLPFI